MNKKYLIPVGLLIGVMLALSYLDILPVNLFKLDILAQSPQDVVISGTSTKSINGGQYYVRVIAKTVYGEEYPTEGIKHLFQITNSKKEVLKEVELINYTRKDPINKGLSYYVPETKYGTPLEGFLQRKGDAFTVEFLKDSVKVKWEQIGNSLPTANISISPEKPKVGETVTITVEPLSNDNDDTRITSISINGLNTIEGNPITLPEINQKKDISFKAYANSLNVEVGLQDAGRNTVLATRSFALEQIPTIKTQFIIKCDGQVIVSTSSYVGKAPYGKDVILEYIDNDTGLTLTWKVNNQDKGTGKTYTLKDLEEGTYTVLLVVAKDGKTIISDPRSFIVTKDATCTPSCVSPDICQYANGKYGCYPPNNADPTICTPSCGEGLICRNGQCVVKDPTQCIGGCSIGTSCVNGMCIPENIDPPPSGSFDVSCGANRTCNSKGYTIANTVQENKGDCLTTYNIDTYITTDNGGTGMSFQYFKRVDTTPPSENTMCGGCIQANCEEYNNPSAGEELKCIRWETGAKPCTGTYTGMAFKPCPSGYYCYSGGCNPTCSTLWGESPQNYPSGVDPTIYTIRYQIGAISGVGYETVSEALPVSISPTSVTIRIKETTSTFPACGDGICQSNEGCDNCQADCGICPYCGDGKKDASRGENCMNCPADFGFCTDSERILYNTAPKASFTNVVEGKRVTLDASTSMDSEGKIVQYFWDYGDGDIDEGILKLHDYSLYGDYIVTLTVVDEVGAYNSKATVVQIRENIPWGLLDDDEDLTPNNIDACPLIPGYMENRGCPLSDVNGTIPDDPVCGDKICNGNETCSVCPKDCGECKKTVCGNEVCDNGETYTNCPQDCSDTPDPPDDKIDLPIRKIALFTISLVLGLIATVIVRKKPRMLKKQKQKIVTPPIPKRRPGRPVGTKKVKVISARGRK